MHPIRLNLDSPIPLLQEDDVRNDLGARVGAKGVVRQPECAQQLRTLRDVFAHFRGLLIHCVAGGNKGDHAARAHLVDGLSEEVVVNGKTELTQSPVVDLIVAKGHVADGEIEEVAPVRRFKARDGNISLGIKLPRDAPGDAVQLHTVQTAARHAVREHPKEIADAAAGLQNVTRLESHLRNRVIDGADNSRAGVVRVQCRGSRRVVFLWREDGFKGFVFLMPRRAVFIKRLRQAAPAHIAREYLLLIWRCQSTLGFNLLEPLDGGQIVAKLGFRAAFSQMFIRNPEIFCHGLRGYGHVFLIRLGGDIQHDILQFDFLKGLRGCLISRKQVRISFIFCQQTFKTGIAFRAEDGIAL